MSKILVVEDDKLLSNAYRLKFTSSGHDVRIAQDGNDAINVMKDFIPNAIVGLMEVFVGSLMLVDIYRL